MSSRCAFLRVCWRRFNVCQRNGKPGQPLLQPALRLPAIGGLQHQRLQVGVGVGLGFGLGAGDDIIVDVEGTQGTIT